MKIGVARAKVLKLAVAVKLILTKEARHYGCDWNANGPDKGVSWFVY
jgi:hypothetical protein